MKQTSALNPNVYPVYRHARPCVQVLIGTPRHAIIDCNQITDLGFGGDCLCQHKLKGAYRVCFIPMTELSVREGKSLLSSVWSFFCLFPRAILSEHKTICGSNMLLLGMKGNLRQPKTNQFCCLKRATVFMENTEAID